MGGDKPLPYNKTVGAGFIPARETTDWRCFDILSRQNRRSMRDKVFQVYLMKSKIWNL